VPSSGKVLYSTVVWLYTWPKSSPEGHAGVEKAARDVSERELALEEKYQKLLERVEALEELDAAHEHLIGGRRGATHSVSSHALIDAPRQCNPGLGGGREAIATKLLRHVRTSKSS